MKEQIISEITRQMLPYLDNAQLEHLLETLQHCLWKLKLLKSQKVQCNEIQKQMKNFYVCFLQNV